MKMTIVGAGAIGGMLGAHMVAAGHDITLCDADRAHIDAIRASGLTIEGPIANFTVHPTAIYDDELTGQHDCVMLAVKSHHTKMAASLIAPHLSSDGVVLTVQNGLTLDTAAQFIDPRHIVTAFINIGADVIEPGRIRQGNIAAFYVGEPLLNEVTERVNRLVDALPYAKSTTNILGFLWGKEAYGAMLYAGAVSDLSIADSLSDPRYHDLMIAIAREVLDQAPVKAEGFDGFEPDDLEGSLERLAAFNAASAKTHSGIYRDLMVRRRPTEVADLLRDLSGPLTTHIGRIIEAIERNERTCEVANLDLANAYYRAHRFAEPLHAIVHYLEAPRRAPTGPLHGYQVAIKDIIAVAGTPLGNGNPIDMTGPPSSTDAPIVATLREAGADVFATTSLLEYALGSPHPGVPEARNPVAPALVAGGSSGGSAVIVAVGAAQLALGTDTGGSVRIPAHYCNVVGFKPTYGHLPIQGITPLAPTLDHVGILARDVATTILGYQALMGSPVTHPGSRRPRLGVVRTQLATDLLDPIVAQAIHHALDLLTMADEVLELLGKTLDDLPLKLLHTQRSPVAAMTDWLAGGESPAGFTIDRELELRSSDAGKATVRYVRHDLEGDEIRAHIAAGKTATRLGMTWNDRISFVLTEQLHIKRLDFLDIIKEQAETQAESADEMFDLDFALMTGELAKMLADLVDALGGENPQQP